MSEKELLEFRRRIGFVFQEGALFDSLTVEENVAFRLREDNVAEEEIDTRVRETLRFVEMEEAIEKYPAELSGGMRRRVSMARALVGRPPIVFYDSPTAGLDPVTSQTIINLILRDRDTQNVTSLLATHRVQDAFGLANFRFDKAKNRVERLGGNGTRAQSTQPTLSCCATAKIYFEGPADEMLELVGRLLEKISGIGGIESANRTAITEEASNGATETAHLDGTSRRTLRARGIVHSCDGDLLRHRRGNSRAEISRDHLFT